MSQKVEDEVRRLRIENTKLREQLMRARQQCEHLLAGMRLLYDQVRTEQIYEQVRNTEQTEQVT